MTLVKARVTKELLSQRAIWVGGLVSAPALQLRYDPIDHVHKGLGTHDESEIEAVEVGLVYPGLELIGDSCRRSDNDGSDSADRDMFGDFTDSPPSVWVGARDVLKRGSAGLALDMLHDLVGVKTRKKSTPVQPDISVNAPSGSA